MSWSHKNSPKILLVLVIFFFNQLFQGVISKTSGYKYSWEEEIREVIGGQSSDKTVTRSQACKCVSRFVRSELFVNFPLHFSSPPA